jgi:hypothetical protein
MFNATIGTKSIRWSCRGYIGIIATTTKVK